jgi:hypothetical protein
LEVFDFNWQNFHTCSEENKSNQIFLVLDFSLAIIGNVRDSQKEGLSAKIEK